ncbi:unnamed protein product [Notodromas monacha]|uniref:Autophagy-related protein 9 n=1 Tax=Notodromas monacha TaxID=399045 RepID=A0A7R9BFS2_9CRUS|nr:unnamed protein product [Notodromas monacha]CAG0913300.1 unnamed protein product [Notodromas monacha]
MSTVLMAALLRVWIPVVLAFLLMASAAWLLFFQRTDLSQGLNEKLGKIKDEDLDGFFTKLYWYQFHGGFLPLLVRDALDLLRYSFLVAIALFIMNCLDLDCLSPYLDIKRGAANWLRKRPTISSALLTPRACLEQVAESGGSAACLAAAFIYFCFLVLRACYHFALGWELREYYRDTLGIIDEDLDLLEWRDVVERVQAAAAHGRLCFTRSMLLTELDMCNVIQRRSNLLLSLVDASVLETVFHVPLLGTYMYMTHVLWINLELLFFDFPFSPWWRHSPFLRGRHLQRPFRDSRQRAKAVRWLKRRILCFVAANLLLAPLLLLYRVWDTICGWLETMKRNPGDMASRNWSVFANRLHLRHLNELDHEINYRLNSACEPATMYMQCFDSRSLSVQFIQMIAYLMTSVLGVLILLVLYDESLLVSTRGLVTLMSVSGTALALLRGLVAPEKAVKAPKRYMRSAMFYIHYAPLISALKAPTARSVRKNFARLYETQWTRLEENHDSQQATILTRLLAPILNPAFLAFEVYPRAELIVDFLAKHTVKRPGIGDVCTAALFDLKYHGSPMWWPKTFFTEGNSDDATNWPPRVELSLLRFAAWNQNWRPRQGSVQARFLQAVQREFLGEDNDKQQQTEESESVLPTSQKGVFKEPTTEKVQHMNMKSICDGQLEKLCSNHHGHKGCFLVRDDDTVDEGHAYLAEVMNEPTKAARKKKPEEEKRFLSEENLGDVILFLYDVYWHNLHEQQRRLRREGESSETISESNSSSSLIHGHETRGDTRFPARRTDIDLDIHTTQRRPPAVPLTEALENN